jgi:hypothetical protein
MENMIEKGTKIIIREHQCDRRNNNHYFGWTILLTKGTRIILFKGTTMVCKGINDHAKVTIVVALKGMTIVSFLNEQQR